MVGNWNDRRFVDCTLDNAKKSSSATAEKAIEAAFEKLKVDVEAGRLPDLPSTAEMQSLEKDIELQRARVVEIVAAAEPKAALRRTRIRRRTRNSADY